MGDRPDQTPADSTGPRPARPRAAAPGRSRPSTRSGARGGQATPSARTRPSGRGTAGTRTAGGRAPGNRAAAGAGRAAAATAAAAASSDARPPAGPRRPGSPGRERRQPSQNTMVVLLSVVTVVVISLVVYAFVLKPSEPGGAPSAANQTTTTVDPAAPGPSLPASAFSRFTSDKQGFSIDYPKDWGVYTAENGAVDLDAGGGDAVSVSLLRRTDVATTVENLANIKAVTDGIVASNKSAQILKVQAIMVDGMPGYYYLYTFTDGETGAEGAHAHYFLFRGRNMYTMIFQALPSDGFARLSSVFDQMAESLRTVPDTGPAPEATPTTVG